MNGRKLEVCRTFPKQEFTLAELTQAVSAFADEFRVNPSDVKIEVWNDWHDHTTAWIVIDMILQYEEKS